MTATTGGPTAHVVHRRSERGRRVSPDALLVTVVLGGFAVAVWPVLLTLSAAGPLLGAPLVAHVAGMLAGYAVVVLIGMMSRTPALERGVGADRLARWHSRGGRITVSLVLVHAVAAVTAWAQAQQESAWLAVWHVLRMPWLIATTIGTVLLLAVAVLSIRLARRRIPHERWHTVHLLTYVAVALTFVHQLAGPDLAGHRIVQVLWALLYTQVAALVLVYRVLTPLRAATRHRMRVEAVVPEGPGVVSIHVTGHALDELQAESGQFFRWRFLTPDHWGTAHPFSLSAAPSPTHLRLTVKALGDGSRNLQSLEPGTWVVAEGPYGAVTAERRTRRNVLLVAGGVGITPMRALFETMPLAPGQDLLLLYRARTAEEVIFGHELDAIAHRRGARVQYLLGDRVGPLTAHLFRHLAPDVADRDVFFCGSPRLATGVRAALREAGLPDARFHEERFDF